MRIAYVAHMRFPSERAHAVQIVSMANAFAVLGNNVDLYVTTRKTHITEEPETYYGVHFLFQVMRAWIPDIVGRIHRFPRFLHTYLYTLERLLFGVAFLLKSRGVTYDIVYCRDEWVLRTIVFLRPSQKVVWESLEAKLNAPAKVLLERGKVVVISEGILKRYLELGYPASSFVIAHDAVDDRFFAPHIPKSEARRALGLSSQKPVALYIGGFDAWKGVGTFFEASASAPGILFAAIGGKPEEISSLAEKYKEVMFLGPHPYKELPQHQQGADILVIPNTAKNAHSAEYTSPLKLFAHMTSGVPLVLSDIKSLRNVLSEEEAFFCTPDDPRALGEAIIDALSKKETAVRKAEHARRKSELFTWKRRAEAILHFVNA